MTSYRTSHTAPGYGASYDEGYKKGYNYAQWEYCERPVLESVFKNLADTDRTRYLDFACGTGRITRVAEQYFDTSNGIDVSEAMLQQAKQNTNKTEFQEVDITKDKVEGTYDVISSFRFITNAEESLSTAVLLNLYKLLDSNGRLVVNIHRNSDGLLAKWYRFRKIESDSTSAQFKSYDDLDKLLAESGFIIDSVNWYSFLPKTARYPQWLLRLLLGPVDRLIQKSKIIPRKWAQCFVVVARKT